MDELDLTVHIGLLLVDLHIPESRSMKSKRRVIKSIKDRAKARFNVSVGEVGALDKWQRAVIGFTMISNDKVHIDQKLQAVLALVREASGAQLLQSNLEFL